MEGLLGALAITVGLWLAVVLALVLSGRGVLARELATLLPDLVVLFAGLVRDPAVPRRAKVVLALAGVWLASPIDLIPEFVPVAGPLDDAIVAALALRYVLRTTEATLVASHWRGSDAMLERLMRLAGHGAERSSPGIDCVSMLRAASRAKKQASLAEVEDAALDLERHAQLRDGRATSAAVPRDRDQLEDLLQPPLPGAQGSHQEQALVP